MYTMTHPQWRVH